MIEKSMENQLEMEPKSILNPLKNRCGKGYGFQIAEIGVDRLDRHDIRRHRAEQAQAARQLVGESEVAIEVAIALRAQMGCAVGDKQLVSVWVQQELVQSVVLTLLCISIVKTIV